MKIYINGGRRGSMANREDVIVSGKRDVSKTGKRRLMLKVRREAKTRRGIFENGGRSQQNLQPGEDLVHSAKRIFASSKNNRRFCSSREDLSGLYKDFAH